MRGITDHFNMEQTINNINRMLDTDYDELPHFDTLDDIFKDLSYEELEELLIQEK